MSGSQVMAATLLAVSCWVVIGACPTITYKRPGVFKTLSGFNSGSKSDRTCHVGTYSGKIKSLGYAEEDATTPLYFVLQLANTRRVQITLDDDIEGCFSEVDGRIWESQLKKNARVSVRVWQCGASGNSDLSIAGITFL